MADTEDWTFAHFDDDSDTESVASAAAAIDDEPEIVECILAQGWSSDISDDIYLTKWKGCPITNSSWETLGSLLSYHVAPRILSAWQEENRLQREGRHKPFDVVKWVEHCVAIETAERRKRTLRRLRRELQAVVTRLKDT